jgi:hypothetical protein
MAMTDARSQLVCASAASRTVAFLAAGLLILVGLVFQLGELIAAQLSATSYWPVHVVVMNLWNALIVRLSALGFEGLLRFWPLLLVGFGLAILVALLPSGPVAAPRSHKE